jgi:4-hydroxy-tetrahydrodipicolinate reductase
MAAAIAEVIDGDERLRLTGVWARDPEAARQRFETPDVLVSDSLDLVAGRADVLIDFSLPAATETVLATATELGKPLVCGVSGLGPAQMAQLDRAAERIPIVFDRNMSQGVAVLGSLVRQAAAALGDDFRVEIRETHHVHKVDAPSGTALKLGEIIAAERNIGPDDIRYEVERRGEVPGDHAVVFRSASERLEFLHSVTTRAVFAEGAVRAARWVVGRAPGRYAMPDVLF